MCAREAYPKGDAKDEVIETRSKGGRMDREGKTAGLGPFLGADERRYMYPVKAAKVDWMVLRKIE